MEMPTVGTDMINPPVGFSVRDAEKGKGGMAGRWQDETEALDSPLE